MNEFEKFSEKVKVYSRYNLFSLKMRVSELVEGIQKLNLFELSAKK